MRYDDPRLLERTRRHFFRDCAAGLGKAALASLMVDSGFSAVTPKAENPLAPRKPHYSPRG